MFTFKLISAACGNIKGTNMEWPYCILKFCACLWIHHNCMEKWMTHWFLCFFICGKLILWLKIVLEITQFLIFIWVSLFSLRVTVSPRKTARSRQDSNLHGETPKDSFNYLLICFIFLTCLYYQISRWIKDHSLF